MPRFFTLERWFQFLKNIFISGELWEANLYKGRAWRPNHPHFSLAGQQHWWRRQNPRSPSELTPQNLPTQPVISGMNPRTNWTIWNNTSLLEFWQIRNFLQQASCISHYNCNCQARTKDFSEENIYLWCLWPDMSTIVMSGAN